jgi:hypothetical protein
MPFKLEAGTGSTFPTCEVMKLSDWVAEYIQIPPTIASGGIRS